MKNLRAYSDQLAISLSLLCTIHCLAVPVLLVALPSLASLRLDNEAFHIWMIIAVLPISLYALTLGCKKHKRYRVVAFGCAGLVFLVAAILGEDLFGEAGEKSLTVIGSALLIWGHIQNYRLCREHENCDCPEHSADSAK
ncbi:MAG: MerC domain-containing protein [Pseudomonadales bacterium]|nr:MerC domain-containing protein [Pseudomonadales bacterium]